MKFISATTFTCILAAASAVGCGANHQSQSTPAPAAPLAANRSGTAGVTEEQKPDRKIPLPAGVELTGETAVSEIHEFPEEVKSGAGHEMVEANLHANGVDREYETKLSYKDAVSFYDRSLKADDRPSRRTTSQTATVWSMENPKGETGRVVVRNTTPTTIEIVSASEQSEPSPSGTGAPSPRSSN